MPHSPRKPVGCAQCWPESAEAAWKFRQQLVCERTLVDESHFSLAVQKLALALALALAGRGGATTMQSRFVPSSPADGFDFNAIIDNNEVILTERNHHGGVDHSQCR